MGFKELTGTVQHCVALAAFASHPADGLLAELLADDRVTLRYKTYTPVLAQEIEWLDDLPPLAWLLVSELCDSDVSPGSLNSEVMSCAHTAIDFIHT